jgi:hypothetical protein
LVLAVVDGVVLALKVQWLQMLVVVVAWVVLVVLALMQVLQGLVAVRLMPGLLAEQEALETPYHRRGLIL